MEPLLSKLVEDLEIQENFLMEINVDILRLSQKVKLHATAIKLFEQHFGEISVTLNQSQLSNF